MEFQRDSSNKLLNWKALKNRKPLLLRGARQVGKTTLVRQFAREFHNYIELSLERKPIGIYLKERMYLPGTSVFRKGLYFTAGGIILALVLLFL